MKTINQDKSDTGSASVEMALMFPALILVLLLILFTSRIVDAENSVQSAAQEAARAATLTDTSTAAESEARRVANENLESAGLGCGGGSTVTVDVSGFEPGGYATVTISCTAALGDLQALGVPGSRTFRGQATEIIDVYRSEE